MKLRFKMSWTYIADGEMRYRILGLEASGKSHLED
jgi:hypothetical protein